jgi:tetratricopeptide (TPR) repeat protein
LAEQYFEREIAAHPKDYAPYLALGDMYTAARNFRSAEVNYENAYQRMPTNALIVAGATNAALESHNMSLAQQWLERANAKMNTSPQVQRERERYLTFKGDYAESAKLGYKVISKLPNDREAVVYLAYDLYYIGHYDEALALANKYEPILHNDKDLPLIAGNVHAHNGDPEAAVKDFTRALERDPKVAMGYVNRGFVLNDLKQPERASKDFQTALQIQPKYGEAHLGLAFADLQLHRPKPALAQLEAAQRILGKSHTWHLARAEAFRQELDYAHAVNEYRLVGRSERLQHRIGLRRRAVSHAPVQRIDCCTERGPPVVAIRPEDLRPDGAGSCQAGRSEQGVTRYSIRRTPGRGSRGNPHRDWRCSADLGRSRCRHGAVLARA